MSKIARYQGNLRAFASNAQGLERTVFGGTNQADDLTSQITASFLRGWGIVGASEHPSLEDFNAAMYAMSQFIAYQHQMGVPEWHAEQEYHIGSICTHNGESYQSLQNANIGSQPPSAKWTPVLTSKNGLANLGLGEAAKQGVATTAQMQSGTATNLLPSVAAVMSLFSKRTFTAADYIRIPDVPGGLIIQWGSYSPTGGTQTINLPVAFPNENIGTLAVLVGTTGVYGFVTTENRGQGAFDLHTRRANTELSTAPCFTVSIGW
ncbi:gp53-like domain-containing protein [Hafnia paralvei]|uniref:gp53-like domain-containing protein n=1 Tax=Hafnia paralvei TaxID=546367 RepID=UPI00210DDFD3|nr:carbohydrate-binding protein [Hafnia paralvei]MCQ4169765.1 carbohydrate-binding protein [Hafnia paralvei]